MADLAILPANVREGAGKKKFEDGEAGEVIDAGEACYFEVSTSLYKLAINETAEKAAARGLASHSAELGQPIRLQTRGEMSIGVGVEGVAYFLSVNAGKAAPEADVLTNDFKTLLFIARASNRVLINPVLSGAQVQ